MAIRGVLKSGIMQIRVLNIEEAVKHYVGLMGMIEVCRTADGRVCLKSYDEFDHHSFVLRETDKAGMDFLGFKVESEECLAALATETQSFGLQNQWIEPESDQPGFGRRLAVLLPTGHRIDLYATVSKSDPMPGLRNPDIWVEQPKGMGVACFDHALLYGPNSAEAVRYFTEVLGLGKVEVAKLPEGEGDLCTWLSCASRTHDVAVLEYEHPGKLHHVGFKLDNWNDIGRAADLITIHNASLDAGPFRHGVTRGQTIYFFDPSGNRNEVYASGYAYYPDMPTRVWDFDQIGKGIFYYTRELNDRFLSIVT